MLRNHPTTKGTPCRMPLRKGKCLIHNTDLSKRNRKVARAFKRNHPEAFSLQRKKAGHNGFVATGGIKGWEWVNEKARQWRLKHPSQPEQVIIDRLAQEGLNHYEREYPVGNSSLDFAWANARYAIECEFHPNNFGDETRKVKQDEKIARLIAEGWTVLRYAPSDSIETLVEFARVASQKEQHDL